MFIRKSKIKELENKIEQLKKDNNKVFAELNFLKKYDKTEVVIKDVPCSFGFGFGCSFIKHKLYWLYNGELKELETDIFGISGVATIKTNEKDYAIIETCTKNYYMLDKANCTITKVTNLIEEETAKKKNTKKVGK